MARLSDEELQGLVEACGGSSPGPWAAWLDRDDQGRPRAGIEITTWDRGVVFMWKRGRNDPWSPGMRPEDAEFCALARNLVPALLEELMELRGLRDADDSAD